MPGKLTEEQIYELAKKRVEARRGFTVHLIVYVCVNAMLICLWAFVSGRGFPWFIFPLGGWGIGLIAHYFQVSRLGTTDGDRTARVEKEAERIRRMQG